MHFSDVFHRTKEDEEKIELRSQFPGEIWIYPFLNYADEKNCIIEIRERQRIANMVKETYKNLKIIAQKEYRANGIKVKKVLHTPEY